MAVEAVERKTKLGLSLFEYRYKDPNEALQIYNLFPEVKKVQMGTTYQKSFAGDPWKEKCRCPDCNRFRPSNNCSVCGKQNLPEAYPMKQLLGEEFPQMVTKFSPGVLILAEDPKDGVVGFTTGGFANFSELIDYKYKAYGPEKIKQEIKDRTGLQDNDFLFYENETCVQPEKQKLGTGSELNLSRIDAAIGLGATAICGRSVNERWLKTKENQLTSRGFKMQMFIPEGDDYVIEGQKRYFFLATKIIN